MKEEEEKEKKAEEEEEEGTPQFQGQLKTFPCPMQK
jgi:hypothetical protein